MHPLHDSLSRLEAEVALLGDDAGAEAVRRAVDEVRRITDAQAAGADAALAESRRALDVLIGNVPGMVYRCRNDPAWTLEYVSPGSLRLTGYRPDELLDNRVASFGDLVHPDDRDAVWHAVQEVLAAHGQFDLRYRLVSRDGVEKVVRDRGRGVFAGDTLQALEGYLSDVTQEVRAREALHHEQAYFRALIDNAQDVISVLDRTGLIRYKSPAVHRELGYQPEQLVGRSVFDFLHPDDMAAARTAFRAALGAPRAPQRLELRVRHADDSWQLMAVTLTSLVDDPAVGGVVANSSTITARRRAEEALQRAHNTLAALVQNAPLAIVALDPEFRVQMWNPRAEEIFGWTAEETIGHPNPLFGPDEEAERAALREQLFTRGEGTPGLEQRRRRKDGAQIEVFVQSVVLRDPAGRPVMSVAFFGDITQRKQLEGALRQAQKMDAVGRLAGGVAHDFNNLLTVIKGNAQMALLDTDADHPLRADLEQIDQTADRAAALTRQLLAFSRQQVVRPEVLDMGEVVRQVEPMLRRLIGAHVLLRVEPGPDGLTVEADRGQLEQVLVNLAVNARDAMPEGGTLLIAVAPGTLPAGAAVVLSVSDTGTGMDADMLPQIFEPFFTTKPAGRGTGLGLSTVYGIVQQNGGDIQVESQPGEGTTVRVLLPGSARARGEERPAITPARVGGSESILVVEDEPGVRALTERVLREAGYRVSAAADGGEALERLDGWQGPLDLVITDVVMPVMGGRELVSRLAQHGVRPAVLYISGYAEAEIAHHGILGDGIRLLEKPFAPAELLQAVRGALDEAR